MNKLKRAINDSAVEPMQVTARDTVMQKYCFPPDFIGFSGHFPGYPILPALVQLMIGVSLLEERKGRTLKIETLVNAKFLMELRPNQEILVQCQDSAVQGKPGSKITLYVDDRTAASFSMTFKERVDEDEC